MILARIVTRKEFRHKTPHVPRPRFIVLEKNNHCTASANGKYTPEYRLRSIVCITCRTDEITLRIYYAYIYEYPVQYIISYNNLHTVMYTGKFCDKSGSPSYRWCDFIRKQACWQKLSGGVNIQQIRSSKYKALRSAGGIRRPLRLLRKEKWCEADKEKAHA